jgi:NAD(P)-dependent dehydrogenase (short-subunit alcohol dehydrogenase family)
MTSNILYHFITSLTLCLINVICFCWSFLVDTFARKTVIDYSKHVVVITGCDSGFGELTSHRLAEMGFRVFSGCMTEEGVQRLQGVVAEAHICDVTKDKDIENLTKRLEKYLAKNNCKLWGGNILNIAMTIERDDYLRSISVVNNAGIGNSGAVDWIPVDTIRKVMEVNFFGVVLMTKALLPYLKRTKNSRYVLRCVALCCVGLHSSTLISQIITCATRAGSSLSHQLPDSIQPQ